MATADLVVWLLAARAGWAALELLALALTAATWIAAFPEGRWGWSIRIPLSVLIALFGLAPLPALAARGREVGPVERAVLVLAPAAFLIASWPFLAWAAAGRRRRRAGVDSRP
jgi:hypothetical protein